MLLWRDMYPKRDLTQNTEIAPETIKDKPWLEWGRPQGGFLDLGCVSCQFGLPIKDALT
jgi:tRNASer (uridine44-2'-O)-methyltransferase